MIDSPLFAGISSNKSFVIIDNKRNKGLNNIYL